MAPCCAQAKPFLPDDGGLSQVQFRPVLGILVLASNTKNVPFLSVAGEYWGKP